MNAAQKILIEKGIGWIGVMSIGGLVLILLNVLLTVFREDLREALYLLEEFLTDEEAVVTYGLIALAASCFWLKAFLRAGRLGS